MQTLVDWFYLLATSADPGEMLPYVAFHLGLYCLSISSGSSLFAKVPILYWYIQYAIFGVHRNEPGYISEPHGQGQIMLFLANA